MRNLTYKAISIMKFTKDTLTSQVSSAVAAQIVSEVCKILPTHIEVATPMDTAMAGDTPKTIREYYAMWCDAIHGNYRKVVHRGTYNDFEGLYSTAKKVGASRIPIGTVASAPTDGQTTWLGRVHEFCVGMADHIEDGDVWGAFPEATGHGIFSDGTSFLASPVQNNYSTFFNDMKTVVTNACPGKTLLFAPAHNYSELNSGWINADIFSTAGALNFDHYGTTHAVAEMNADLRAIYSTKGSNKPVRLHEWGDYWNENLDEYSRLNYLKGMYNVFSTLNAEGKMDYFGYWGAWDNDLEGILDLVGGLYKLNTRGKLLARAWQHNSLKRMPIDWPDLGTAAPPVPPPPPTTVPRGIAISGLEFGGTSEQATYNYFASKGFNTARIAFKWETLQPYLNGALDATAKADLDTQIARAGNANLKVILDCHSYGRRIYFPNGGFTDDFANSNGQTTFRVPYSDSDTGAGTLLFRDYGRGIAGTLSNGPRYKFTITAKFENANDVFAEAWFETMRVDDNNRYTFVWNPTTDVWRLSKVVSGVTTQLATGTLTCNIGTFYTIVVDVGNTTNGKINVSVNGTPVFTTNSVNTDATLTAGYVGIWPAGVRLNTKDVELDILGDTTAGNTTYEAIGGGVLTKEHLADMWSRIATAYANNSTVYGFDIMNEPHDMPVPTTTSNYNTNATVTLMHQASINAIRLVTATKWILCCFDSWGGAQSFVGQYGTDPEPFLTDPANKLIYSFHYYFDDDHSGTFPIAFKSSNESRISDEVAPVMSWAQGRGLRVHCGEYGVPNTAEWQVCLTTFLGLCNLYNVWANHWAAGDPYTSTTTLQPTSNYTIDRLQMAVVGAPGNLGTIIP